MIEVARAVRVGWVLIVAFVCKSPACAAVAVPVKAVYATDANVTAPLAPVVFVEPEQRIGDGLSCRMILENTATETVTVALESDGIRMKILTDAGESVGPAPTAMAVNVKGDSRSGSNRVEKEAAFRKGIHPYRLSAKLDGVSLGDTKLFASQPIAIAPAGRLALDVATTQLLARTQAAGTYEKQVSGRKRVVVRRGSGVKDRRSATAGMYRVGLMVSVGYVGVVDAREGKKVVVLYESDEVEVRLVD